MRRIRKIENKLKHTSALVLPLTLSFMLISQLSYWGLLHLNKTNLYRLKQMTSYYQSEIQQTITDHYLDIANTERLEEDFSSHLFSNFIHFLEHNMTVQKLSVNPLSINHLNLPQYGWLNISDNIEQEKILIYQTKVFLDPYLFNLIQSSPEIYFSGLLSQNFYPQDFSALNQINPNPFPMPLVQLLEVFIQEDYRLIKNLNSRKIYDWSFEALQDQSVEIVFNTGRTHSFQEGSQYLINSQINLSDLNRLTSHPLPQGNYLLQWEGLVLVKNK